MNKNHFLQYSGRRVKTHYIHLFITFVFTILAVGCLKQQVDTPRIATQEAQSFATTTPLPTPLFSAAPTATPAPDHLATYEQESQMGTDDALVLWVNETSAGHRDGVREILKTFTVQTGIQVEERYISSNLLPDLLQTAVISDTIPDLILHPVEYSIGWADAGILDPEQASAALDRLDPTTFIPSSLEKVAWGEEGSKIAALPSDGSVQLIIYRSDWLESNNLASPNTFDNLLIAAEATFDPETAISGLVVPTESDLVETQQVFEHFALANGCQIIDSSGRVSLMQPACLEALDYYRQLVNQFSPIGFQTNISALNAYLSGRTGMIISTPEALSAIAGLDLDFQPSCESCNDPAFLIENSGVTPILTGNNILAEPTVFGEITALGITTAANPDLAQKFVDFWFDEGYPEWLAINPERKIPLRTGKVNNPDEFVLAWKNLPLRPGSATISDMFGPEVAEQMLEGMASSKRWAFDENQGALMTTLYKDLILAPLLQEMLSGYFTSSQTIVEMYRQVVNSIPDYPYPLEIVPTSESG